MRHWRLLQQQHAAAATRKCIDCVITLDHWEPTRACPIRMMHEYMRYYIFGVGKETAFEALVGRPLAVSTS
eukprot:COSAG05_NODE_947_length_6480_cov_15.036671_7_plen_71_part_00